MAKAACVRDKSDHQCSFISEVPGIVRTWTPLIAQLRTYQQRTLSHWSLQTTVSYRDPFKKLQHVRDTIDPNHTFIVHRNQ